MTHIGRVSVRVVFAFAVANGISASAQDETRTGTSSKVRSLSSAQGENRTWSMPINSRVSDGHQAARQSNVAGDLITCDEKICAWCWLDSSAEGNCPPDWLNDEGCDCGCQFADNGDCGTTCNCPSNCDFCWCNTSAENACDLSWNGDGTCDCACQFNDTDCAVTGATGACCTSTNACSVRTPAACTTIEGAYAGDNTTCGQVNCPARCAAGCEACWVGTPRENDCDPDYEGDGFCDCGCQFVDPDCGPQGACCVPANGLCDETTQLSCTSYLAGVFNGVGTACTTVDCQRCDIGCEWCWTDTIGEHACPIGWSGDGECDCGCQFADPDCAGGVCGNLICEKNARECPDDCKDLRAFADFQNCFKPGAAEEPQCYSSVYANPPGVGLEDYAAFQALLFGP